MNKLLKLLLGLVLFLLFGYWCIYQNSLPSIENDIKNRTLSALHDAGYSAINVDVNGRDVILSGNVSNGSDRSLVETNARVDGVHHLENQLVIDTNLKPTGYYLTASNNESGKVELSGFIADNNMHHNVIAYAMHLFNNTPIKDNLIEKSSAPEEWTALWKTGLDGLKQLETGQLQLTANNIELTGKVKSEAVRQKVIASLASQLPTSVQSTIKLDLTSETKENTPGQKRTDTVESLTDDKNTNVAQNAIYTTENKNTKDSTNTSNEFTCKKQLKQAFKKAKVTFRTNSSEISPSSYPLLNEVVAIKLSCIEQVMKINGHTDALGNDVNNQKLSESRARAVMQYLTSKGLDESKMSIKGFGESQPLADNRTREGRKMNRRIEILIEETNQ